MTSFLHRSAQMLLPALVVAAGFGAMKLLASLKEDPTLAPAGSNVTVVETISAAPSRVQLVVHAQGVVRPRTHTTLVSEVEARVVELAPEFREGGFFEQGALLLRLDDTDLRLALEQAKSAVASSQLQRAQEEADAALSTDAWNSLHTEPAPPLVAHAPQLASVRAELEAARAALEKAQHDVERTRIHAPYPGRVSERLVDVGAYVMRGRELALIYAVDFAEVRLPIPDKDLAALDLSLSGYDEARSPHVRLGAEFAGKLQAWEGQIVRTAARIDEKSRMLTLIAEIPDPFGLAREGDPEPLLSGLFVDAWIDGRTLDSAFAIPRKALRTGKRVFLLGSDERLVIRNVNVVRFEPERAIVDSGLKGGERIITTPLETPVAGMRLENRARELGEKTDGARIQLGRRQP